MLESLAAEEHGYECHGPHRRKPKTDLIDQGAEGVEMPAEHESQRPVCSSPRDTPGGFENKEGPVGHPGQPRQKRAPRAQPGDEASDESGLAAVTDKESFAQ